jgi:hypothetical protein
MLRALSPAVGLLDLVADLGISTTGECEMRFAGLLEAAVAAQQRKRHADTLVREDNLIKVNLPAQSRLTCQFPLQPQQDKAALQQRAETPDPARIVMMSNRMSLNHRVTDM